MQVQEEIDGQLLAKRLRAVVADRSCPTAATCEAVRGLLAEHLDVNIANRNDKTAIHFTAQLRSDTEVLGLLVAAKADVNVTTARGHTPLIYAAGRGRANVVEFLLDHGADAATWTVQGDCAVSMGRRKGLPPELLARLQANQKASSMRREFKDSPRAIRAQAEHRRHNWRHNRCSSPLRTRIAIVRLRPRIVPDARTTKPCRCRDESQGWWRPDYTATSRTRGRRARNQTRRRRVVFHC